MDVFNKLN